MLRKNFWFFRKNLLTGAFFSVILKSERAKYTKIFQRREKICASLLNPWPLKHGLCVSPTLPRIIWSEPFRQAHEPQVLPCRCMRFFDRDTVLRGTVDVRRLKNERWPPKRYFRTCMAARPHRCQLPIRKPSGRMLEERQEAPPVRRVIAADVDEI